jgi:hypothetical protein
MVFIEMRSGSTFSPWAPGALHRIITPAPTADFDFGQLVSDAVAKESELEGDDTEGDQIDPVATPFAPPAPLSLVTGDEVGLEPSGAALSHTTCLESPPPRPSSMPETFVSSFPLPRQPDAGTHGPSDTIRRKRKGHVKRAMRRHLEKLAAPHGDYAAKPKLVNRHVRPATPIVTVVDAQRLKRTKMAWTGARDKGGYGRVFTLDEMVGDNSRFKFKLERWDGW